MLRAISLIIFPILLVQVCWAKTIRDGSELHARQASAALDAANSILGPIESFFNALAPNNFIRNPDSPSALVNYDDCKSNSNSSGICINNVLCGAYGGTPDGSCPGIGMSCCVNQVSTCDSKITINNTYWQSPASVSSNSQCGVTIKLDSSLIEQKMKICQIRLDFVKLTLAQPAVSSVCSTDSLTITGTANKVPTICGDNDNQHMYLWPTGSTSEIKLAINLGQSSISRSWKIQVSLLPCGATFLAPTDCLQYFTSPNGIVSSFNWRNTAVAAGSTRMLANQDYQACFRTELLNSQAATRVCYTPCSTSTANIAFSLSGAQGSVSGANAAACPADYLIIRDGSNSAIPAAQLSTDFVNKADRFCGGVFNPSQAAGGATASVTVCTSIKDFSIVYRTDGSEAATDSQNTGFCLNYQEFAV